MTQLADEALQQDSARRAGRNGGGVSGQCGRLIKELDAGIAPFLRVIAAAKRIEKLSFAPEDDRLVAQLLADMLRSFRRDFAGTPRRAIDCVRELAKFEGRARPQYQPEVSSTWTDVPPAVRGKLSERADVLAAFRNGKD